MAVETYIVTIEDFRNRANISSNLLTDRFKMESGIEQERYAIKMLCRQLYDQLLTEISTDTLTPENETLLPYLKDYLVFKIYASYLVDGNYIATASGLRTQVDTTSNTLTESQLATVIDKAEKRANFYQDELANFLRCNEGDYPLWKNSSCACQDQLTNKLNKYSKLGKTRKNVRIEMT